MTKQIYSCQLCDWVKISENILDFNVHASTEHIEFFFIDPKDSMRNEKRLRDYVNLTHISTNPREKVKGTAGPI